MSTATIIIILFIITLAAIGLIFFIQARERARIQRARQLAAAEDAFQHNYRILDELPPQYLNDQLCQLIVDRLEELALPLKALNSRLDVTGKLEAARNQSQQPDRTAAPVRIETPETVRYIKSLLESLFKLVESQHKARKLESKQARGLLKQVLFLGFRTQADLHIHIGREEAARGNLRKAIHHYHMAATELSKSKDHPVAQKVVKACKLRIQELESEASTEGAGKPAEPAKGRLDEQLDEFIQEEESWKKRADFES